MIHKFVNGKKMGFSNLRSDRNLTKARPASKHTGLHRFDTTQKYSNEEKN